MTDKYNLTEKQNIFIAKKSLVQHIYESARLEGVNATFPQTQAIIDGYVDGVSTGDVETILNLRNAWRYVLDNIDAKLDLAFIMEINSYVSYQESLEWGVLRTGEIGISGVKYRPPIPEKSEMTESISKILQEDASVTEIAIKLMLFIMRSQIFWDGNKRTATIAANKLLIRNGKGVLSVPEADLVKYNELLRGFYESGDMNDISDFLYEHAISAFGFSPA